MADSKSILAKIAGRIAERARAEIASRAKTAIEAIRARNPAPEPAPQPARPQVKAPAPQPVKAQPKPARVEPQPARVEPQPARVEPQPARVEPQAEPQPSKTAPQAPAKPAKPQRGKKGPKISKTVRPAAPEGPEEPDAPDEIEPLPKPGKPPDPPLDEDFRVQATEDGIADALERLRSAQRATAALVKQLESLGMGEAARAVVGLVEERREEAPPAEPKIPIFPIQAPVDLLPPAPGAPPAPGQAPTPPKPAEPASRSKRKEDSPRLQGSKFYVGISSRKDAFRVLWDEWQRAGIGQLRATAGAGEEDRTGRARGLVLNPEDLKYLPKAEVVVPGRDGSLLVPMHIIVDEDAFNKLLDQWGIGDRITIEVEGMYRADGPVVTHNTWYAGDE